MLLRILGVLIGIASIAAAVASGFKAGGLATLIIGVAFIAYGIGGQKLLEKVAPSYAEKNRRPPT